MLCIIHILLCQGNWLYLWQCNWEWICLAFSILALWDNIIRSWKGKLFLYSDCGRCIGVLKYTFSISMKGAEHKFIRREHHFFMNIKSRWKDNSSIESGYGVQMILFSWKYWNRRKEVQTVWFMKKGGIRCVRKQEGEVSIKDTKTDTTATKTTTGRRGWDEGTSRHLPVHHNVDTASTWHMTKYTTHT